MFVMLVFMLRRFNFIYQKISSTLLALKCGWVFVILKKLSQRFDKNTQSKTIFLSVILGGMLLLTGCGPTPDMQQFFSHLNSAYPNLWRLVTAASYIMGFAFMFKAIHSLKVYGEQRTMMSNQTSMKGPITYFIVSAALIFSPNAFHILMQSSFGYGSPLSYQDVNHLKGWTNDATLAILRFIQFAGLLAFIRGWLYIARAGDHSSQPGNFAKGLTHLAGGILAINITGTWQLVQNTFGFNG